MTYRRLGKCGLKVSSLSFGSWVTFGTQMEEDAAIACLQMAYDAGVNFFDTAEVYASGQAEEMLGEALSELSWPRESYIISTKYYWGVRNVVNMRRTLNRKYLLSAVDPSLDRLGLDFVDLIYCHRPDPDTPIEEVVWTMSDIVASGRATYWGTSEWPADDIRAACEIAERHHLRRPVVEQPQYNILNRTRVEAEYARLYEDWGIGLTTWSPLASGLLTGKYRQGVPSGSRASLPELEWLRGTLTDARANATVDRLEPIAQRLGCSLAQLAIAFCLANQRVSSVILGASRPSQLEENLAALTVADQWTDDLTAEIDEILST